MGIRIKQLGGFALLMAMLLGSMACSTGGGEGSSSPKPTATAILTTIDVNGITAGYAGAPDAGDIPLQAQYSYTGSGYMIGVTEDGGAIIAQGNAPGPVSLNVWYPQQGGSKTLIGAIPGMEPLGGNALAVDSRWIAAVYIPDASASSPLQAGWELIIVNRQTGAQMALAQDRLTNLPGTWAASLGPLVALNGGNLFWSAFLPGSDGPHAVMQLTNLETGQTTNLADEATDSTRYFAQPTSDGNFAAWCDFSIPVHDVNNPTLASHIVVYALDQQRVVKTIAPSAATNFIACAPSMHGTLLAFSVYGAHGGDTNGVAFTNLADGKTNLIANDRNRPNFPMTGDGIIGWSVQPLSPNFPMPLVYDTRSQHVYTIDQGGNPDGSTTLYVSGNVVFWRSTNQSLNAEVIG